MSKKISGTKEWAATNENIQFGCENNCLYCYAKAMSPRHKKIDIEDWDIPINRYNQINKKFGKRKGTIMFPTTHDITPENIYLVIPFLRRMLEPGNKVLIVSKPNLDCIEEICNELYQYREQILFRFTIGSANDQVLKFWEPGAPRYGERLESLRYALFAGYRTSISCEPMLDQYIETVIAGTIEYVTDAIWLGKMNDPTRRLKINGHLNIPLEFKEGIRYWMNNRNIFDLYEKYHDNPKIKWKESIKEIVGLKLAEEKGLDI